MLSYTQKSPQAQTGGFAASAEATIRQGIGKPPKPVCYCPLPLGFARERVSILPYEVSACVASQKISLFYSFRIFCVSKTRSFRRRLVLAPV